MSQCTLLCTDNSTAYSTSLLISASFSGGCWDTKYTNPTDITCIPSTGHELTPLFAIQVLDGEIQKKGMVLPFAPEMYRPMLKRLRDEGIQDTEKSIYL